MLRRRCHQDQVKAELQRRRNRSDGCTQAEDKPFREAGGRNQEEEERVRVLGPEVGPNRKYENGTELSEVKDQALPRRNLDGNQPRKYFPSRR